MKIGVLALQGDFDRHAKALARCGVSRSEEIQAVEVRKPAELADVDGLIIPGGESTTLLKLMEAWGFVPALEKFHAEGRPIFGTCAGLILLARDVDNPRQFSLDFIDVGVERNAYGRQRESFEARGSASLEGRPTPVEMVFIREPRIRRVGAGVETLAPAARGRAPRTRAAAAAAWSSSPNRSAARWPRCGQSSPPCARRRGSAGAAAAPAWAPR